MAAMPLLVLMRNCRVSGIQLIAASAIPKRQVFPSSCISNPANNSKLLSVTRVCSSSSATKSHDHSKHWTVERLLTVGLVGLIPTALTFPSPALNYALALSLTMHAHWGLEAIVIDYIRPRVFGKTIANISLAALYGLSIFAFGSLCYFNYADVGIAQAIRMIWAL